MSEEKKKIGYGNPPKHTQFGSEGKPGGRPKGAKNRPKPLTDASLRKVFLEMANRPVAIRENGEEVEIPMKEAVARRLLHNAITTKKVSEGEAALNFLTTAEEKEKEEYDAKIERYLAYGRRWYQELAYQKKHGIDGPKPLIHPDDIFLNTQTGEIICLGLPSPEGESFHAFVLRNLAWCDEKEKDLLEFMSGENDKKKERTQVLLAGNHSLRELFKQHILKPPVWVRLCR